MVRPRTHRDGLLSALAVARQHFQANGATRLTAPEVAKLLGVTDHHAVKVLQRLQHERVVERVTAYRRRAEG